MKYLICLFVFFAFSAAAQDVILKKDGSKIDAKVVELTSTTIKYRSWTQQDGPIRNIAISEVKEIIYNDGTWEKFDGDQKPATEEPKEETITEDRPTREKPDLIMKSGFFLEGILGAGIRQSYFEQYIPNFDPVTGFDLGGTTVIQNRSDVYPAINLRIGSKFYFGAREKWRPGVQATWLRLGIYIDPEDPMFSLVAGPKTFSVANVGMTNVFKFTDKIGMEANLTAGYNMDIFPDEGEFTSGIATTLEAKFRYNRLAVGLDYMRIFGISGAIQPADYHVFGVSIGAKF